jgi:hypothetical protein
MSSSARTDAFGKADPEVMGDPTLSMSVKAVYGVLITYANSKREAYPSRATIAEKLGASVRTVDAALKAGEKAGLFSRWSRENPNGSDRETSKLIRIHDFGGGFVASPTARGAKSAPLDEHLAPVQYLHPRGANSAPELDKGTTQEKDSPPARPPAAAGGRRVKADAPKTRRNGHPLDDDWKTPDDPDFMVDAIRSHVESLYGEPPGLHALLMGKAEDRLDEDGYVIPGTAYRPLRLMNLALKAGLWQTTDFNAIKRAIAEGRPTGDLGPTASSWDELAS